MIALETRGVVKRFGHVTALQGVSIELQGPGIVGLIGPNGSGKSTLLGILSGLIPPTEGTVYVAGAPMTGRPPHAFAAAGLARTFQQVRLVPILRVWENIAVGAPAGLARGELRARVARIASRLGVGEFLDAWPEDLPAGIQRRVQVATAMVSDPRVVLLDEPAAGLTDAEATDFVAAIRDIARTALVLVVEHNMQLVYSLAERVLVLMEGSLVADGPPGRVAVDPKVQEAYLGIA